jgi:hypothetical protein
MKTKALVDILTSKGNCKHKDGKIEIGEETEVALYTSLGSETLLVSGLSTIVITDDLLVATTRKGDTYAIVAEDLRALRVAKAKGQRRTGLI